MELMPGYKQTEVGVIPEDWEVQAFKDGYAESSRNGIYKPAEYQGRGTRIVNMGELFALDFISDQEMALVELSPAEASASTLRDGDLLFGRRSVVPSGAGKCSLIVKPSTPLTFESSVIRVRLHEKSLSPLFYYYFFSSPIGKRIMAGIVSGTNVKGIRASELRELKIPRPPLSDQREVEQALNDIDGLIAMLNRQITKKRQIKQAAMQELLTGKRRLPGFEGEWEVMRLGSEIRDLQAGVSVTSTTDNDQTNTDHYVLKTSAVVQGRFIPSEKKEINPGEVKRAKKSIRKGDLIISRMNTPALVGECGYSDSDHPNLYLPDRLWRAAYRDPSAISSHWLSYALSMQQNRIRIKELATGTSGSMKNISKRALLNLEIKWPSLEEQTAIAEILSEMDADIDAIGEHLLKAQGIKQGMMQQLLTGKIRLI